MAVPLGMREPEEAPNDDRRGRLRFEVGMGHTPVVSADGHRAIGVQERVPDSGSDDPPPPAPKITPPSNGGPTGA